MKPAEWLNISSRGIWGMNTKQKISVLLILAMVSSISLIATDFVVPAMADNGNHYGCGSGVGVNQFPHDQSVLHCKRYNP
jgi:hypothetical protein